MTWVDYLGFGVKIKASWQALKIYPNYFNLLGQIIQKEDDQVTIIAHDQERRMTLFLPWW
jgi:hypothetical protein